MGWLNWPNRITIARIVLIVPLLLLLLQLGEGDDTLRRVTFGLLVVMALSDAVDGYLARRLHAETALGRFLDPLADKLLIAATLILFAVPSTAVPGFRLPVWVPVLAIAKDVLVALGSVLVRATTDRTYIQPRWLGKACTLIQLVLASWTLLLPDLAPVLQQAWRGLYWLATGLAVAATVDYLWTGNRFAAAHHAAPPR